MFPSVIVGFDASDQGRDALVLARALTAPAGQLVVCCVYPPDPPLVEPVPRELSTRAEAEKRLRVARDQLGDEPRATYMSRRGFSAAEGLQAEAQARGAELLVVGSSHHGTLGRILPGSVTRQALQAAPCAVAVAPRGLRDHPPHALARIGVAYDGSEQARVALGVARQLASESDAAIEVIAVVDVVSELGGWAAAWSYGEVLEAERASARAWVDEGIADLQGVTAAGRVLEGGAADLLIKASEQLDLLVLGSRNYGPLRRALMGTVSGRVADHAHCPVVVIPRGARADGTDGS